jgi:hypothetical protein
LKEARTEEIEYAWVWNLPSVAADYAGHRIAWSWLLPELAVVLALAVGMHVGLSLDLRAWAAR